MGACPVAWGGNLHSLPFFQVWVGSSSGLPPLESLPSDLPSWDFAQPALWRSSHSVPDTAFSLSLNNLMTKKGRTILTSFAGSIGIIGIALILAISNGINAYIALVQEDALSTYPLSIQAHTQDYSAMMDAMTM